MLAWSLGIAAAFFAALALASSLRIRAVSAALRDGSLRYDGLEAGFAAERLKAVGNVRRAALILCAFCAVGTLLSLR